MDNKAEVTQALDNFKEASLKLLDVWNRKEGSEILNSEVSLAKYPFGESFEDVVVDIIGWINNIENSGSF